MKKVETNLVIAWVDPSLAHPDQVVEDLQSGEVSVLGMTFSDTNFRLTFHLDISDQLATTARVKMAAVIKKQLDNPVGIIFQFCCILSFQKLWHMYI